MIVFFGQHIHCVRDDQIKVVDLRNGVGAVCQVRQQNKCTEEVLHCSGRGSN